MDSIIFSLFLTGLTGFIGFSYLLFPEETKDILIIL